MSVAQMTEAVPAGNLRKLKGRFYVRKPRVIWVWEESLSMMPLLRVAWQSPPETELLSYAEKMIPPPPSLERLPQQEVQDYPFTCRCRLKPGVREERALKREKEEKVGSDADQEERQASVGLCNDEAELCHISPRQTELSASVSPADSMPNCITHRSDCREQKSCVWWLL